MDKKDFWTALLAAMAVFVLWTWVISPKVFPPKPQPAPQSEQQQQQPSPPPATPAPVVASTQPATSQSEQVISAAAVLAASRPDDATVDMLALGALEGAGEEDQPYFMLQADLSTRGSGVQEVRLTDYFETPDREKHYQVIREPSGGAPPSMAIIAVDIEGHGRVDLSGDVWGVTDRSADGQKHRIVLSTVVKSGSEKVLTLHRTWSLAAGGYELASSLTLVNHTGGELKVTPVGSGVRVPEREGTRADERMVVWGTRPKEPEQAQSKAHMEGRSTVVEDGQQGFVLKLDDAEKQVVNWAGASNKFFAAVMRPVHPVKAGLTFMAWPTGTDKDESDFHVRWTSPAIPVPAGQTVGDALACSDFVGPKSIDLFKENIDYVRLDYPNMISYGGCGWCMFDWLMNILLWLLHLLVSVVRNYGVAIMILVAIVRVCLHPLTKKSQVSMAKMAKLQPRVEEIKKQYGDDKDAMNKALRELYAEQGLSPLLGCLPMMLQMPIWIALWGVLNASIELRHAPFALWIRDLSAPDMLWQFAEAGQGHNIPLLGNVYALNLLPLLLIVAMFFQQWLTPRQTSGPQAKQMKAMLYIMPLFMGLIFYNFPSGLSLYVMASTAVGAGEQYFIRKHIREQEEAESAGKVVVGKKESRPKAAGRSSARGKRRR